MSPLGCYSSNLAVEFFCCEDVDPKDAAARIWERVMVLGVADARIQAGLPVSDLPSIP
jgi:hypothetical protein